MTCKVFIYAFLQEKRRFYNKPPFSGLDGSRTYYFSPKLSVFMRGVMILGKFWGNF